MLRPHLRGQIVGRAASKAVEISSMLVDASKYVGASFDRGLNKFLLSSVRCWSPRLSGRRENIWDSLQDACCRGEGSMQAPVSGLAGALSGSFLLRPLTSTTTYPKSLQLSKCNDHPQTQLYNSRNHNTFLFHFISLFLVVIIKNVPSLRTTPP